MSRYLSIDELRRLGAARLQEDVDVPGTDIRFGVQALTQEEMKMVRRRSRDKDNDSGMDEFLAMQLVCVYGIVEPDIDGERDEEGALAIVRSLPLDLVALLSSRINGLTNRPAQEAFKSFTSAGSSPNGSVDSLNGISSSPAILAMDIPA